MEKEEVQKELKDVVAPQEKAEVKKKLKVDRKLIIAGCIIVVIVILGLVLYFRAQNLKNNTSKTTPVGNTLSGSVLIDPSSVVGKPRQKITADVMVNTGGKQIKGITVGIKYNPQLIDNITLTPFKDPHSALSYALTPLANAFNDSKNGRIILTLILPTEIKSLSGVGKIAELSFTISPINVAVTSTSLSVASLTNFIIPNAQEKSNLTKNELKVTLPAGVPLLSPSPIYK
jgi:hypothetical protein